MTLAVMIAAIGTLAIYFAVRYVKSIRQIMIFYRVRELILMTTFYYLKHTPNQFVDLNHLELESMNRLTEHQMKKWVKALKVSWAGYDVIEFKFELDFSEFRRKYQFAIGIKDIQQRLEDYHTK